MIHYLFHSGGWEVVREWSGVIFCLGFGGKKKELGTGEQGHGEGQI